MRRTLGNASLTRDTKSIRPLLDAVPRLAIGSGPGNNFIYSSNLPRNAEGGNLWAVIDPYLVTVDGPICEIAKVTAIADGKATLDRTLVYAHGKDGPVLLISEPVVNVMWYGATGLYADDAATAVDAIVTDIDYGTLHFPNIGGRSIYKLASAVTIPEGFDLRVDPGAVLWVIDGAGVEIKVKYPVRVEWFGADSGAAATGAGCSISSGSTQLTVDTASTFKVGNGIYVPGAGAAGANLFARIVAISGTTFTLDTAAGTTVGPTVRCLADESININSALDACFNSTWDTNKELQFTRLHQVCQPVIIDCGFIRLKGTHYTESMLSNPLTSGDCLRLGANGNVVITDLGFNMSSGTGINSNTYQFIDGQITRCWFTGTDRATTKGIDCLFSTTTISDCVFDGVSIGINVKQGSGYVTIDNPLFAALGDSAINLMGVSGTHVNDININNVQYAVDQPAYTLPSLLRAEYVDRLNVNNVTAKNQLTATAGYLLYGFRILGCTKVNINNVALKDALQDTTADNGFGLYVNASYDVSITNYKQEGSSGNRARYGLYVTGSYNVFLSNFLIDGTILEGIYLNTTSSHVVIRDGKIKFTGETDNAANASVLVKTGTVQIENVYFESDSSHSDYAFDLAGVADGNRFRSSGCFFDGYVGGILDESTVPSNPTGFTIFERILLPTGPINFAANDATPSVVRGYPVYKTANNTGTTITMIDGGYIGQTVLIIINDANTTVDFTGTNLKGNVGADWTPASGDSMTCTFDGTNWYCDVHDNTA